MARLFDGVDDQITTALGGLGTLTALTIGAIIRLGSEANAVKGIFHAGTATNPRFSMFVSSTEKLTFNVNGVGRASTTSILIADGWVLACVTKAAGTSTGKAHIYKYAADTWVHENLSGGSTDPGGTPSTGILLGAGTNVSTPASFFTGDIAAVGVWDIAMTDAQTEALAYSLSAWLLPSARCLWLLDQDTTAQNVVDLTGGGANQTSITGTTVSTAAVSVFSYGHDIMPVRADAAVIDRVPYFRPYSQLLAH